MKKNKQNIIDVSSIVVLIISSVLLINPFGIIMTSSAEMILLGVVSLSAMSILVFLWNENPQDERDEAHLLISGRISFFAVAITLLVALVVETFQHDIDPWVPITLTVLLLSKVASLFYLRIKK